MLLKKGKNTLILIKNVKFPDKYSFEVKTKFRGIKNVKPVKLVHLNLQAMQMNRQTEPWRCMNVHLSLLPHAVRVEVKVWTCFEDWASHAATWLWEWRMSVVEKSARTRFCLSSPLCPQGASLS